MGVSTGSTPRVESSSISLVISSGVARNSSPKVRGSTNRICPPWVKVMVTWVCLSTGSLGAARSSWPDMRRWITSTSPVSSGSSRYFPLRWAPAILTPSSLATNSAGVCRRIERLPVTSTVLIFLPTISRSSSRRMVSTSGSSGMVLLALVDGVRVGGRPDGHALGRGGQVRQRGTGGGLLGELLGPALAPADDVVVDADRGEEALLVIGAVVDDLVGGGALEAAGDELLQLGLVVGAAGPTGTGDLVGDAVAEQAEHQLPGGVEAAVDVDRPDHGLHGVGQDRGLLPSTARVLALAEAHGVTDAELAGDLGQGRRADDS